MKEKLLSLLLFVAVFAFGEEYNPFKVQNLSKQEFTALLVAPSRLFARPISDREWWQKNDPIRRNFPDGEITVQAKIAELLRTYKSTFSDADWSNTAYGTSLETASQLLQLHLILETLRQDGSQLPEIENYMRTLCRIRTWIVPHHDRASTAFSGKERFISLESARVSTSLSLAVLLVGDRLPPDIVTQTSAKVREWIIEPYLAAVQAKQPTSGMFWIDSENNWNPACHAGVLAAAAVFASDEEERAELLYQTARHVPAYLNGFGDDGFCFEGIHYWLFGMNHYVFIAETLRHETGGKIDLLSGTAKIDNILRFPERLEMGDGLFPAYGDCTTEFRNNSVTLSTVLFRRFGIGYFKSLSIGNYSQLPRWQPLTELLAAIAVREETEGKVPAVREEHSPGFVFADSNAVTSRGRLGKLSLALSAGNNGVTHNHNDVGTFVIGFSGTPMIVDTGYGTDHYFEPATRYKSDLCNSWGHSVPLVNDTQQQQGKAFYGKLLSTSLEADATDVLADLKNAYPAEAKLKKLERRWHHDRQSDQITLTDEFELTEPGSFESALLTFGTFLPDGKDCYRIHYNAHDLKVRFDAGDGELEYIVSPISARLSNKKIPFRLGYRLKKACTSGRIQVFFDPSNQEE